MKLSKLSKGALNFSKNGRKFLNIFILFRNYCVGGCFN